MRLLKKFDAYLLNGIKRKKESHYASSLMSCLRQQYYSWFDVKQSNPVNAGAIIKMEYGNLSEKLYEEFLKDCVSKKIIDSYTSQVKERYNVDGLKYPISCVIDYVVEVSKKQVAIELKSMFGRGIVEIAKTQEPKKHYLDQIYVYIKLTPFKEFNHVYIGRDNGYRTEFEIYEHYEGLKVVYTTEQGIKRTKIYKYDWDKIVYRLKVLEKLVENKKVPAREHSVAIKNGEIKDYQFNNVKYKSDWQCKYCSWIDLCWKKELCKFNVSNNSEDFKKQGN